MADKSHWKLVKTRSLRQFRTVNLLERTFRHEPSGQERAYAACESADWVFVIPITKENEVVLIRQAPIRQ